MARLCSAPLPVRRGGAVLYGGVRDVAGPFVRADGREWLALLPAARLFALLERQKNI